MIPGEGQDSPESGKAILARSGIGEGDTDRMGAECEFEAQAVDGQPARDRRGAGVADAGSGGGSANVERQEARPLRNEFRRVKRGRKPPPP